MTPTLIRAAYSLLLAATLTPTGATTAAPQPLLPPQAQELIPSDVIEDIRADDPIFASPSDKHDLWRLLHMQVFRGDSGKTYLILGTRPIHEFPPMVYSITVTQLGNAPEVIALSDPCSGCFCPHLQIVTLAGSAVSFEPERDWCGGPVFVLSHVGSSLQFHNEVNDKSSGSISWDSMHKTYRVEWPDQAALRK